MELRTKGLVIRNHNLGEADRIIRILSPTEGVISAVARGARKATSPFSAKTQPLTEADFLLVQRKSLALIKEVVVVNHYVGSFKSLLSMTLSYYMLEVCEYLAADLTGINDLYLICNNFLQRLKLLESYPEDESYTLELILGLETLWLIISELGYKPELDRCSLTKQERKLNQIAEYFDLNNGSICSRQAYFNSKDVNLNQDANIIPLDKLCFKLLKILDMNIPSFENKTLNDYLLETNFYSLIAEDDQLEQPFRQAFKLLAKHLEMQTHKVPKSFKALEEFL